MIRRLLSVLVIPALLSLPLIAQEEEVVTFKVRGPAKGEFQASVTRRSSDTTMNMVRDGEASEPRTIANQSTTNRDATILETKDGVVTKVKLHWREVSHKSDMDEAMAGRRGRRGGGEGAEPAPDVTELTGKTLILDLSGEAPTVVDEEGAAVSEGLARIVVRMETAEGKFNGWSPDVISFLGKKEFKVGETISFDREVGDKVFGPLSGMRGSRMRGARRGGRRGGGEGAEAPAEPDSNFQGTLTFKGKRNTLGHDCGLFEIKVTDGSKRETERGTMNSSSTVSGEMLVGLENGWLYKLDLKGKGQNSSELSMGEQSFSTSGESTMELSRTVIFAAPKAEPKN